MSKLSDNIWFTRKARIQASERLLSNDNHSQILLVLYSIINTCLSIMLIKNINGLGNNTDLALVIMSVIILVTSLFVTNKNFKGRALSLKNHYIELQKIYYNALDAEENNNKEELNEVRFKYTKLLELEENHNEIDDFVFRVLNRSTLTSRKPTIKIIIITNAYKTLRFLLLTALYILPFIAIYFISKI